MIKITECPRDAMQSIDEFIPTELKIRYINSLLKVGFDVIDFGSFVSHKAIPQLSDTPKVISGLDLGKTKSSLLSIVANERGALAASYFDEISIIGFPFSVSERFQINNTNKTREASLKTVNNIQTICSKLGKKLRVYLSMGFGNPYGEIFNSEIVLQWAKKLKALGVSEIALSDTIGVAQPILVESLFKLLSKELRGVLVSAHFHTLPHAWEDNIREAFNAGCVSFDSAIGGFGGCPLSENRLVGNLATENLVNLFKNELRPQFNFEYFKASLDLSEDIFLK